MKPTSSRYGFLELDQTVWVASHWTEGDARLTVQKHSEGKWQPETTFDLPDGEAFLPKTPLMVHKTPQGQIVVAWLLADSTWRSVVVE